MNKIIPVNGHLLIEPIKHESFMSSQKDVYEEVGIVLALSMPEKSLNNDRMNLGVPFDVVKVGDKVFFDAWLAAKFPKDDKEWFWLVKWEDVRAVQPKKDVV